MSPQTLLPPERTETPHAAAPESDERREWLMVGVGLCGLVALMAIVIAVFAIADGGGAAGRTTVTKMVHATAAAAPAADAAAPTLAQSKGVAFEKFAKVDPSLPAIPAGAVKKFTVDVDQHNVQVDPELAPTQAWTYTVNGKVYKGTAASPPIVVTEGDKVAITFVNGGPKGLHGRRAPTRSSTAGRRPFKSAWRPRSASPPPKSTPASTTATSRPASRRPSTSSP